MAFFHKRERLNSLDEDNEPEHHHRHEYQTDGFKTDDHPTPAEFAELRDFKTTRKRRDELRLLEAAWQSVQRPRRAHCIERIPEAPVFKMDFGEILDEM